MSAGTEPCLHHLAEVVERGRGADVSAQDAKVLVAGDVGDLALLDAGSRRRGRAANGRRAARGEGRAPVGSGGGALSGCARPPTPGKGSATRGGRRPPRPALRTDATTPRRQRRPWADAHDPARLPARQKVYWIQDNLSANRTPDIVAFADANRIEIVPTPTYATYLNRDREPLPRSKSSSSTTPTTATGLGRGPAC